MVYCAYPPLCIVAKHTVWSSSSDPGKLHHLNQIQCNPLFWYIVVTQLPRFIHILCVASFVPPQNGSEPVWVVKPETPSGSLQMFAGFFSSSSVSAPLCCLESHQHQHQPLLPPVFQYPLLGRACHIRCYSFMQGLGRLSPPTCGHGASRYPNPLYSCIFFFFGLIDSIVFHLELALWPLMKFRVGDHRRNISHYPLYMLTEGLVPGIVCCHDA